MKYKNGFFQMNFKEDGVYIKIYPAMNGGKPLLIDDVLSYLNDKRIMDYDLKILNQAVTKSTEPVEIKVSPEKRREEDEYLRIKISEDRMKAVGRFYPPSAGGKLLTKEDIIDALSMRGVRQGIVLQNIDLFLKSRAYCTNIKLAAGKEPIQGKHAEITYYFNTAAMAKPRINKDGSVDFHQLDNISRVNAGDVLATLIPADPGTPGLDVMGNEIKPFKVNNKKLIHGNNIHVSEDGLTMYSDISGHASLAEERVFVSNTYEVPADVGPSTGDIDYDGSVLVRGNIITGFTVRAKGDIIVEGVVEGATLIADGQIILKRGIQGMGRGTLKAEGDITTKFIENSTVISNKGINTDAIMHSNVLAKGDIAVSGKRGLITGGEVKAGVVIEAKTVGSTMGSTTVLEVGVDPELLERYKKLDKDMEQMQKDKEKADQTLNMFKRKLAKGEKIPADKLPLLKTTNDIVQNLTKSIDAAMEESMAIREEMDQKADGKIKVEDRAYPGVKIVIAGTVYFVKTETHHCQFIRDRADIAIKGF